MVRTVSAKAPRQRQTWDMCGKWEWGHGNGDAISACFLFRTMKPEKGNVGKVKESSRSKVLQHMEGG